MFFKFEDGSDDEKPDDKVQLVDEDSDDATSKKSKPQKIRSASSLERPTEKFQTDQHPMAFSYHTGVSLEKKFIASQKMAEALEKSQSRKSPSPQLK